MGHRNIQLVSGKKCEGSHTLVEHLLAQQHAAYVRVHDDRIGWPLGIFHSAKGATLQSFKRKSQTLLIGHLSNAEPLHAHHKPRLIHHREHGPQTIVGLPNQPTACALEVEHAGR